MEDRLHDLENTVITLNAKTDSMLSAVEKMATSIEKLASHGSEILVLEERCDSRALRFDEADKVLHKRVDKVIVDFNKELFEQKTEFREDLDKIVGNQTKVMWLIITAVILSIMKLVLTQ